MPFDPERPSDPTQPLNRYSHTLQNSKVVLGIKDDLRNVRMGVHNSHSKGDTTRCPPTTTEVQRDTSGKEQQKTCDHSETVQLIRKRDTLQRKFKKVVSKKS